MKQKCIEKMNEAKEQWKEKFAEKVAEIEQDYERRMAEKDRNFSDFRETSDRKTRNLELKIRDLERQLARSRTGTGLTLNDGFGETRRENGPTTEAAANVGVGVNDADFDFDTAFDFDLPPAHRSSVANNFPEDGSKAPKAKRPKADAFNAFHSQKFFTSGQVNKTSGFGGVGDHGAQPPAVRLPPPTARVHGSVFAAMSFVAGPHGAASATTRFESFCQLSKVVNLRYFFFQPLAF